MIVFDLKCSKGHFFEEWFSSNADFEAKVKAGETPCPQCGDTSVTKALMAPNLNTAASSPKPAPGPACGSASDCSNFSCPMAGRG